MSQTLIQRAVDVAAEHGVAAEAVSGKRAGNRTVIMVRLANGREIATDAVEGWETELSKNIAKFKNKK